MQLRKRRRTESALPSGSLIKDYAKGDGNCAFNAIALSLGEQDVLDRMPEPNRNFINKIMPALRNLETTLPANPTWDDIKKCLVSSKKNCRDEYQRELSAKLREFSIDQVRDEKSERGIRYKETIWEAVKTEFQDYVYDRIHMPIEDGGGDIAQRHQFVKLKYEELFEQVHVDSKIEREAFDVEEYLKLSKYKRLPAEESEKLAILQSRLQRIVDPLIDDIANTHLKQWWFYTPKDGGLSGHQQFLTAMSKPADSASKKESYGGDLELAEIANALGINLVVKRGDFTHQMTIAHGYLPIVNDECTLDIHQAAQLRDRGIVDREAPIGSLRLLEITQEDVHARLDEIPDFDYVDEMLRDPSAGIRSKLPLDRCSRECIKQLRERSVISGEGVLLVDPPVARERIKEVRDADKIFLSWQAQYIDGAPITLINEGGHWDSTMVYREADHDYPTKRKKASSKECTKEYTPDSVEVLANKCLNEILNKKGDIEAKEFEKIFDEIADLYQKVRSRKMDVRFFKMYSEQHTSDEDVLAADPASLAPKKKI